MNLTSLLELLVKGGGVRRYHNEPVEAQTVGHHSFGVAWFCWILCDGRPTAELLYAAIHHDVAEGIVGDVPAPAKRAVPGLKDALDKYEAEVMLELGIPEPNIDGVDKRTLKFADIFEGMLYCTSQRHKGNKGADGIFENFVSYVEKMEPTGKAREVYLTLLEIYDNVSK